MDGGEVSSERAYSKGKKSSSVAASSKRLCNDCNEDVMMQPKAS